MILSFNIKRRKKIRNNERQQNGNAADQRMSSSSSNAVDGAGIVEEIQTTVTYRPVLLRFPSYTHRRPVIPLPSTVHWGVYRRRLLFDLVEEWQQANPKTNTPQSLFSMIPLWNEGPAATQRPSWSFAAGFTTTRVTDITTSTSFAATTANSGSTARSKKTRLSSSSQAPNLPLQSQPTPHMPLVSFQFVNVPNAASLLSTSTPMLCVQRLLCHRDVQIMQRTLNDLRTAVGKNEHTKTDIVDHLALFEQQQQQGSSALVIEGEKWFVTEQWFEGSWISLPVDEEKTTGQEAKRSPTPLTNTAMVYLHKPADPSNAEIESPLSAGVALPSLLKHGEAGVVVDEAIRKRKREEDGWVIEPICAVGHILTLNRTR